MFRVCTAALTVAVLWFGQSAGLCQRAANAPARIGIKGSEHPELIPDREAIGTFFIHISDGPAALPWKVRVNFLAPSGLTSDQITAVINAANCYRARVGTITTKVKKIKSTRVGDTLSANDRTQIDNLRKQQQSDLDAVIEALADELGPEANERFILFIQRDFKATMVYYPPEP